MRRLIYTLAAVGLFLAAGCKENTTGNTTTATDTPKTVEVKDNFETGVVIPAVSCKTYPAETYALYLPKAYTPTANLPCILFFDPHGDGTLPVEKYKTLAEEFGFILAGSNVSNNQNVFENNLSNANTMALELTERFHTYNKQLAFCGFSGGAKVALVEGPELPQVNKLIYCGAVLPLNTKRNLDILGFAGTRDMNYTDLVQFDMGLKNSPHIHYLVEWNGKHEFPSEQVFRDAFTFVKNGQIENYSSKVATIAPQQVNQEQGQKQALLQAFGTQDINWWRKEIASLNAKKKTNPMYERLLGFVSLACYSYSNQLLKQNNLEGAEKILAIYALADPGNKDCEAFTVELNKRKGN